MLGRLPRLAAGLAASALVVVAAGSVIALPVVPFQDQFRRVAGERWIDRAAQAQAESNFNPRALSPVGARGILQFMPGTWREWAPTGADPYDPAAGIDAGHRYMLWLEARTSSLNGALGSYNAGLGNIRKAQRLADSLGIVGGDAWLQALPRVTGRVHAAETRGYIQHNATFRAEIRRKACQ